jgi:uncharacterized phage protein (TIGR01671 family)
MRTIKFRGKSKLDGRWIFGDLFRTDLDGDMAIQYYDEEDGWMNEDVYEKTIGQFTSLFDMNGKEIYEGDIVDCDYILYDPWDDKEEVLEPIRCVVGYEDWGFVLKEEENLYHYFSDVTNIKFIGNIHDNPELLKGGE